MWSMMLLSSLYAASVDDGCHCRDMSRRILGGGGDDDDDAAIQQHGTMTTTSAVVATPQIRSMLVVAAAVRWWRKMTVPTGEYVRVNCNNRSVAIVSSRLSSSTLS